MDDKKHSDEAKSDTGSLGKSKAQNAQRPPASMIVAGLLIAALAVGVGVQLLRARPETREKHNQASISDTNELSLPAVRINGEVITREQLAHECMQQFGRQVLTNLINRKIIQQSCAERGVHVTDAEVEAEVHRLSKHAGLPTAQWYKFIESERGLTPLQYHRDVVWPLLALKKIAGRDVKITRQMLKEAYIDNYGPRVNARMILFDKRRRAADVAEKLIEDPNQFADLARNHSVEPNSRVLGGKVPPIRRYSGAHEEIRKAAFRMKREGQVSPVLQVGINKFAILQYEGRTEPVEHNEDDVHGILHEELVEREVQTLVAETFAGLKTRAKVDNFMTGETTGPVRQTAAYSETDTTLE